VVLREIEKAHPDVFSVLRSSKMEKLTDAQAKP